MFIRWYSEITTFLQLSEQYRGPWDSDWLEPKHGIPTSPAWMDTVSLAAWPPLLAHWKHTVKILRCFSHELVPGCYSYPVLVQWILKPNCKTCTFILVTFHILLSRQQDRLLGYLVSCSVFIPWAYNFAISVNLIIFGKHISPTLSKLLMKILDGTFVSLCNNAPGMTYGWHRDIYQWLFKQMGI